MKYTAYEKGNHRKTISPLVSREQFQKIHHAATQGFFLFQMDRNIIFIHLTYAVKLTNTGVHAYNV